MNPRLPLLVLFLSSIGWGLTWLPLKFLGNQGMEGPLLVFIAFGIGALLLIPLTIRERHAWRNNIRILLLIALFGGFANLAFQSAIYHGNVIRVMILFYLLPVWSVIGGRIFLGETIDQRRMLAVIAALLGAFLILGGPSIFDSTPDWIDLLAIAAGLSFAMNNIIFRASEALPTTGKVNAVFIGCTLMIGGYLAFTETPYQPLSSETIGWTIAYGAIWVMLITFGTQWGVERLEAGQASVIIIMELVVAVLSAALILGESLQGLELAGGFLVLGAALAETLRPAPAPAPTENTVR